MSRTTLDLDRYVLVGNGKTLHRQYDHMQTFCSRRNMVPARLVQAGHPNWTVANWPICEGCGPVKKGMDRTAERRTRDDYLRDAANVARRGRQLDAQKFANDEALRKVLRSARRATPPATIGELAEATELSRSRVFQLTQDE